MQSGTTRRQFLKIVAGSGAGVLLWRAGGYELFAAIPGGTLDPVGLPQFVAPLVVPPSMPLTSTINVTGGKKIDYYEIAVRQFTQQILPPGQPATTVWSYGSANHTGSFNAPSFTIEAKWRRPVRVKWINQLVNPSGGFLPHLLPVDPTLHWANPPGGPSGRDTRPTFPTTPGRYTGPVPIVTHVHGAENVGDESDGYAEAWYLPAANNVPPGHAEVGTWYDYFKTKAQQRHGVTWSRGSATFQYPNDGRAATWWYHDHTLGMTRLNVYAGPAGFYLVRGGPDDTVVDTRDGRPAMLPGPAARWGDNPNKKYFEIPIAIQDRSFNTDGSLFYPDSRSFFDNITGPYIPDTDISPIWNPEFFGNMMMVNGRTWPYLTVEARRYRLRLLNGCQSRFLILQTDQPAISFWQIGTEGGFLRQPVQTQSLLMGPAERADVIIDFSAVPPGTNVTLLNVGPDEPFGGGTPGVDFEPADPLTTGRVMQFQVVAATAPDPTTPPQWLGLPPLAPFVATSTRSVALLESMSAFFADAPAETRLGTFDAATGDATSLRWEDPVTENPAPGTTETWELYNLSADAHPIHIHEAPFEVADRQALDPGTNLPTGPSRPPEPTENGRKDTVIAYPGEVTRVRVHFDTAGQYVWHCHIVEHEDNEMMRPYRIGPADPDAPQ